MTDLRQAAQQALEALESGLAFAADATVLQNLRTALEQQAKPVSHAVIAGALFDFMGWLTSRKELIVLSSADDASPAVDAIKNFAKMRGLSLDDAKVQDWNTTPPQRTWVGLTKEELDYLCGLAYEGDEEFILTVQAKLKEKNT